jgi:hypothetical protein
MNQDRRTFGLQLAGIAAAAAATSIGVAEAAEPAPPVAAAVPEADGWKLSAGSTMQCGTCEFWGGMRKVSTDGKEVSAISYGWCNNPKCRNYQGMSAPVHEAAGSVICHAGNPHDCWTKWGALSNS